MAVPGDGAHGSMLVARSVWLVLKSAVVRRAAEGHGSEYYNFLFIFGMLADCCSFGESCNSRNMFQKCNVGERVCWFGWAAGYSFAGQGCL